MYQQYQQQPHHQQAHGGQPNGGAPNRDAIDPIVARQLYRNELATLTFNSKPIITSLTIAAEDNVSVCKVIVQTIEERLRTAPSNQKLPTLYLIDSIIKNVGGPYVHLFARTIVNLYLDAYAVVDSSTRTSFEKVLATWPVWASPLFSKDVTDRIERGVQSIRQQQQQHQHQQRPQYQPPSMHVNPHFPEPPREHPFNVQDPRQMPSADNVLLQDIQLLMLQKQQAIILNPNDQASAKQVTILQQLENIVKTTQVTPENANMIRQQLAQLWTPPPPGPPAVPGFPQSGISQGMMAPSSVPPSMAIPPPQHLQQPPIPQSGVSSSMAPQLPPFPGVPPLHFAPHMQPPGSVPSPQGMMAPIPTSMPMLPGSLPMSGPPMSGPPMSGPPMSMPPGPPGPPGPPVPMSAPMANGLAPPLPPSIAAVATMAPAPAPITSAVPPAASDLLASLIQSGLLGPNGLLQNTANLNRASPSPAAATPPMSNTTIDRIGQSEQDQSVMSLGLIELTSQDIQRRRPTAIQIMYGTPPLQCNQCGYRCPKSADAQKKMDAHLDWHFRQNRRMKDKAKKSHSRSWLVGEEDWIHSREGDLGQGQQPVFFDFGSGVSKTSKDELALQEEIAALKEQVVPETLLVQSLQVDDAEATIAKGCSICKEKFVKIWSDVEEEWSYKNARVVDKMIFHATCHADLVRSNQRQAALAAAAAAAATATPPPEALVGSPSGDQKDIKLETDHDMSGPDGDLPHTLKRKLEIDQHEQEQIAYKKTILAQDS
ncbi:hypothetical protein BGX31_004646 [Mortierella sp. GBA43]|nr:hypothetical protein BGX31_004646 [Mortierella sp. GBA43]